MVGELDFASLLAESQIRTIESCERHRAGSQRESL